MNDLKKILLCILFFISGKSILFSQQNLLLNQASYNLFLLSPAAIGLNPDLVTNCYYKKNWIGLADSPELMHLTVDGSLHKDKYGLGLNLSNEKAGIFSKTCFSGAFRYRIKIAKNHNLLLGLSAGFQRQLSDFSKIKADSPGEFTQWPQQQAATIPDASFGVVYNFKKMYISFSANQLMQQNYVYKEPVYNKRVLYKSISQFVIFFQNTFTLKPQTWFYIPQITLRTPKGLPLQLDFVNTINYRNKFLIGIGYRYYYALYFNAGYCITDKLRFIYSYEYSQGIQNSTRGGHEIGLTFGLNNRNIKTSHPGSDINKNSMDELFEKLDEHDQQIEVLTKKVDSLDKNISRLASEIEFLKSKQVDKEELEKELQNYFKQDTNVIREKIKTPRTSEGPEIKPRENKENKYKFISPKTEKEFESSGEVMNSIYKIVLGVYLVSDNAREYQKFLKRELGYESILVQINHRSKKYIYVCLSKEFDTLKESLAALKNVRSEIRSKAVKVTRGEAWVLQTIQN